MIKNYKRFTIIFVLILLQAAIALNSADAARRTKKVSLVPDPKKYAAFVVHADTGVVLHEKNADKPRYPASLVKLMTLYLAFEALEDKKLSLNESLQVSYRAASQPSLNMGLRKGNRIKVRDAINAIIVRSANDASVVLAEAMSGSEMQFAQKMNETAKKLGMKDTTFKNATGLFNKNQKSTARDMAKLLIALERDHPSFYRYLSRTSFFFRGKRYDTHNKVLTQYNGAVGGKTGFINASGFNLVTQAKRRGNNLVAVVMGGKTSGSRDKILMSLLDKGFDTIRRVSNREMTDISNIPVPKLRPWQDPVSIASTDTFEGRRLWSIELGGFTAETDAVSAVANAMDAAPEQLAYSQVSFIDKQVESQKSHWAKFIELTEAQAREACLALSFSKNDCKIVDSK